MARSDVFRAVAAVLALVGLWLVAQSPTMAHDAAGAFIQRQGGSVSADTYLAMLAAYAAAYRLLGAVLLGVGAFCALRPS